VNELGTGAPPVPAPGRVIVLTGPPGAGKSTVARLLTGCLRPGVHLHCDDFWCYIRHGRIAPYLPQAHRQNQTVIDALAQAALSYAAGGYQVISDGVIEPWFIDVFRVAATARAIRLDYVILRPDQATAQMPSCTAWPRAGTGSRHDPRWAMRNGSGRTIWP
jgi:energy-coupling factor transporter ATP-binding protein EcfA2